jgi:D-lyxose ketol-isomerase
VTPGTAVIAIATNQAGGYIVNPTIAADQGLATAEVLYVNQVTNATLQANGTTIALQPGQSYTVIPYTTTPVTVSAPSASHKFTAVQWATS